MKPGSENRARNVLGDGIREGELTAVVLAQLCALARARLVATRAAIPPINSARHPLESALTRILELLCAPEGDAERFPQVARAGGRRGHRLTL
jgi:hypothetical protein